MVGSGRCPKAKPVRVAVTRVLRGLRRMAALAFVIACAAAMLVVFSGCKYSDVLTQHIEDPDLGVLDEAAEPVYQSNPDAEQRPDLADVSVDESDDENTQVEKLPHYDPAAPDNGPTKQRIKSPDTPHDEEATEGDQTGEEADRKGDGEDDKSDPGGKSDDTGDNDDESDEGDDEGDGEDLTDDESEDPEQSDDGGGGGQSVVVDPDGTNDDNLAKGTVAAVGEYATIAQMLGGGGALAACDEAWMNARSVDGAFPGELERVQVAFTGDGTAAGSCDVDALVSTVKPAVVLWDSTANIPALSDSERATLEAAGIKVQAVPHIGEMTTEDYAVTTAVQEVAAVLEGAADLQYPNVAENLQRYLTFHNEVLGTCYQSNGGYSYKVTDNQYPSLYQDTPLAGLTNPTTTRVTVAYVDTMMVPSVSSATVAQTSSTSDGVIWLAHDGQTLDVSDGVGLSVTTSNSAYMLMDYYLQLAGVMNNAYDGDKPDSQGRPFIVMPGSTDAFGTSGRYAKRLTASALFYNGGDGTVAANWHVLGNEDFPAILTGSTEVADAIVASAAKANGLYRMDSAYQVIVVPSGIAGSWTCGHVDSFLMAPWAFCISDAANLDAASSYVSEFYKTFFRCDNWQGAVTDWSTAYTAG